MNFAHGAQYMMGAFAAWMAAHLPRRRVLLGAPPRARAWGSSASSLERLLLRRLYGLDNLYGLLLTFGLTLIAEGLFHHAYGNSGQLLPGARSCSAAA